MRRSEKAKRIYLIHATPVAIPPIEEAFARLWPSAVVINLLDDSLTKDLAEAGELTPELKDRILKLAEYSFTGDADALLYTCSAYGSVAGKLKDRFSVPIFKAEEAMFRKGSALGSRLLMLATDKHALESIRESFAEFCEEENVQASLDITCVTEARTALQAGDWERHDFLLAEIAQGLDDYDAIMLAHFSTARALGPVMRSVSCPVLSSPDSAVISLRELLENAE